MTAALIQVAIGASFMVLVMTLLAALALKFFARPLSFSRALLISLIASSISIRLSVGLIALYYLTRSALGLPQVRVGLAATLIIRDSAGRCLCRLQSALRGRPKAGADHRGELLGARSPQVLRARRRDSQSARQARGHRAACLRIGEAHRCDLRHRARDQRPFH